MQLTAHLHNEDGSYWGEISELPGCFAAGDTLDELVESLKEGAMLYLDENRPRALKAFILHDK